MFNCFFIYVETVLFESVAQYTGYTKEIDIDMISWIGVIHVAKEKNTNPSKVCTILLYFFYKNICEVFIAIFTSIFIFVSISLTMYLYLCIFFYYLFMFIRFVVQNKIYNCIIKCYITLFLFTVCLSAQMENSRYSSDEHML